MIYVLACILIFVNAFLFYSIKKEKKRHFYSERNIIYIGISVFNWIFISYMLIVEIFYTPENIAGIISLAINFGTMFCFILLPVLVAGFIPIVISNISLIRHEGYSLRKMLGAIFLAVICIGTVASLVVYDLFYARMDIHDAVFVCIESIAEYSIGYIFAYLEFVFLGTVICSLSAARHKAAYDKDYIIILGCGMRKDGTPTPLLAGRIERAMAFAEEQKKRTGRKVIFVPSGAKGSDEIISEAECMKNYLVAHGISEDDILMETCSTNTYENMKFSKRLIEERDPDAAIAFSTNAFHVFRAGLISSRLNLDIEGIGSKTKWYFWPNAFLREFVGTLWMKKKFHIAAFLIITVLIAILTWFCFFVF